MSFVCVVFSCLVFVLSSFCLVLVLSCLGFLLPSSSLLSCLIAVVGKRKARNGIPDHKREDRDEHLAVGFFFISRRGLGLGLECSLTYHTPV